MSKETASVKKDTNINYNNKGKNAVFISAMEQKRYAEEAKKVIVNFESSDLLRLIQSNDLRSQKGQFGWETIGQNHIPYVFRGENNHFVALRIVNQIVLPHFCNIFTQDLFDIIVIPSVTITELERRLYNEINSWHCSHEYGLNAFQKGEQLVRIDDVIKLHDVLTFLYARFFMRRNETHPMFGYMSFDKQNNLVPYYKINGLPCFPVVYFEGDDRYLQDMSKTVGTFEECVLRLLMKLQNISPCCRQIRVIGFDDLKLYYEKDTVFIECWIQNERDFLVKRGKSEASILKIVNVENVREPHRVSNPVPVLLMNANDSQRMPPPVQRM